MVDDYAVTYHALKKLDNVYTHITQHRLVEYLASCFVRNEVMVVRMHHRTLNMVKWIIFDCSKKCVLFFFDIGALFFAFFHIPTPTFRVTCAKWCLRIFLLFMFFLLLLPKPYLTLSSHPIKSQPIWKNLAEQKRLWDRIHQTQVHMERVARRVQANIEALQTKLDHVHTWNTTSSVSERFLKSLNGSVEQKIKDTVRKSLLDSVLVEFRDGKIILSPRLVFLLQNERIMNEIQRFLESLTGPQLAKALHQVITIDMENVRKSIDKAIATYHQDDLNRADFAFMSRGGQIIDHSPGYGRSPLQQLFHKNQVQAVIQPGRYVGKCWSMRGSSGSITIRLSEIVQIDSMTIEYPSMQVILSMKNAPKDILVYGSLFTDHWRWIGQVQYDVQGPSIQTFPIANQDAFYFRKVRLEIMSNWGDPTHTDIYRIRIHGKPMLSAR